MGCVASIKKVSPNLNENGVNRMLTATATNYATNYSNNINEPYFLSRQNTNRFDQKSQDEDASYNHLINGENDNYVDDETDENNVG